MRLFLLLGLPLLLLKAASLEVQYAISYPVLGRIGTSTLHFTSANGRYRIEAVAQLEGIAAVLARHHTERHTSIGSVDSDGHLIPDRYNTLRKTDGYRRVQRYLFNHRFRYVTLKEEADRQVVVRRFDPGEMRYTERKLSEKSTDHATIRTGARNDLLTLYFNARDFLKRMPPFAKTAIPSVGSRSGFVRIEKQKGPSEFTVYVDQDIFRSKEGKLHVSFDDAFYIKRLILEDVFLFGDLKVEREWLRQAP